MASQSQESGTATQPHAQLLLEITIVILLSAVAAVRDKPMTLVHPTVIAHGESAPLPGNP